MNTEQFDGHTPGPWTLSTEGSATGDPVRWITAGIDEPNVCTDLLGATDANARLIAAAPELLAEVKRLREELFDTHAFYSIMEQKLAFAVGIKQGLLTSMSMDDLVDSMNRDYHDRLNEHMNGRLRK